MLEDTDLPKLEQGTWIDMIITFKFLKGSDDVDMKQLPETGRTP